MAAGLAWRHIPSDVGDRERLVETLTDAGLAVVVADLVDPTTHDELVGPYVRMVESPPPTGR